MPTGLLVGEASWDPCPPLSSIMRSAPAEKFSLSELARQHESTSTKFTRKPPDEEAEPPQGGLSLSELAAGHIQTMTKETSPLNSFSQKMSVTQQSLSSERGMMSIESAALPSTGEQFKSLTSISHDFSQIPSSSSELSQYHDQSQKVLDSSASKKPDTSFSLADLAKQHQTLHSHQARKGNHSQGLSRPSQQIGDGVSGISLGYRSQQTGEGMSDISLGIQSQTSDADASGPLGLGRMALQDLAALVYEEIHGSSGAIAGMQPGTVPAGGSSGPSPQQLCAKPSIFAKTLFSPDHHNVTLAQQHRLHPKHSKFSYKRQISQNPAEFRYSVGHVQPFDFSTPSPDDIVKDKQKGAFTRNGGSK